MNIYNIANNMEKLKGETKKQFIKRYIDLVCADYSRTSLKAAKFNGWIYSMATHQAEICIFSPNEDEYGYKSLKDENGKYFVRKNLRPYEFTMLEAIASQYYAEKYEGAKHKEEIFTEYDMRCWLSAENLEFYKGKELVKAHKYIAKLMKQNQR